MQNMRTTLYIFVATAFALFSAGCRKNYVVNENQHVLFQYDNIKLSPEYSHEGFYIDDQGNILVYSNPENWNFHKDNYYIDAASLSENLSKCTRSAIRVDLSEISRYSSYIDNLSSSKVTAKKNVSSDAGTVSYICYIYNQNAGIYEGTLIKMDGDITRENLNFYARKVSLWMKDINARLH